MNKLFGTLSFVFVGLMLAVYIGMLDKNDPFAYFIIAGILLSFIYTGLASDK